MYILYHCKLPNKLQSKFSLSNKEEKYNMRLKSKFRIRHIRTTKSRHCLSVFGVKMFNSLPNFILTKRDIHYLFPKKDREPTYQTILNSSIHQGRLF